jgi:hypothetical protein
VCDFGLSTAVERGKMWEDEDDIPGTPLWMAPEVMLGKALGPKSDVYSFGLCLWEFFSCQEPYQAFTNFNDFRRAVCFKFERPKLVPATVCPEAISKLIVRCWDSDPNVRPSFAELLDLYPALFLECMISDEKGKEFWSQAFYHDGLFPAEVGWDQFAVSLAKYLGLADSAVNDTALLCLKALIAEDSRKPGIAQVVTLQTFGEFLQEFGPLVPGQSAVLTTLEELAMYKPKRKQAAHVFHGNLSSAEAEKRLTGQDKGTWLVRVSAKDPKQPYVISKVSRQGAINHQRINYDAATGKYKLEIHLKDRVKTAESEGSLVEFLKSLRDDLYLKSACPGSPFGSVFAQATLQGYLPS